MNRRGFLKGLLTAVAVVAIEVKLARGTPEITERPMRWEEANERYDYGIDVANPLDVAIYDKHEHRMIDVDQLHARWQTYIDEKDNYLRMAGHADAYEATAIVAMSQGRLLYKQRVNVMALVPEHAYQHRFVREDNLDYEAQPWILAAPG